MNVDSSLITEIIFGGLLMIAGTLLVALALT